VQKKEVQNEEIPLDKEKEKAETLSAPELSPVVESRVCPVCAVRFTPRTALHVYCTAPCWKTVNDKQTFRAKLEVKPES
jgi:hypothetical protein